MPEIVFWFRLNEEGVLEIYDKPEEGCTEKTVQLPEGEAGYKEFLGILVVLAEEEGAENMAATHELMDKVKIAVGMPLPPPPPKKRLARIVGAEEGEGPPEVTAQLVMIPGQVASSIRAYAAQYPNTEIWGYLIGRGQTAERAEFLPIEYGEFDKFRVSEADEAGEVDRIKTSIVPGERILGAIHKHISPLLALQLPKNLENDPRYDFGHDRGIPSKSDLSPTLVGPDQVLVMVDPAGKLRQWRRVGLDGAEELTSLAASPAAPNMPTGFNIAKPQLERPASSLEEVIARIAREYPERFDFLEQTIMQLNPDILLDVGNPTDVPSLGLKRMDVLQRSGWNGLYVTVNPTNTPPEKMNGWYNVKADGLSSVQINSVISRFGGENTLYMNKDCLGILFTYFSGLDKLSESLKRGEITENEFKEGGAKIVENFAHELTQMNISFAIFVDSIIEGEGLEFSSDGLMRDTLNYFEDKLRNDGWIVSEFELVGERFALFIRKPVT